MSVFGILRVELTALAWGAAFLAAEAYAFVAVSASSFLRRASVYAVNSVLAPRECAAGASVTASISSPRRFRFPAVHVRYEIPLRTADGRSLDIFVDPERNASVTLNPAERGAFRAPFDTLIVQDAFGFFEYERPIPTEDDARVSVLPEPIFGSRGERPTGGGAELRTTRRYERTDDLTESRKYLAGDDPRRINWKLYGHIGELFVREGEREPPPRAAVSVLADTTFDDRLYSTEAARRAVDELASRALGLVCDLRDLGFRVSFGCSGGALSSGDSRAAATAFAHAAALLPDAGATLPEETVAGASRIVFALPRLGDSEDRLRAAAERWASSGHSCVILFLPSSNPAAATAKKRFSLKRLLILGEREDGQTDAMNAEIDRCVAECVARYGEKRGVRALAVER